jgi:iron complex transport system permease protein
VTAKRLVPVLACLAVLLVVFVGFALTVGSEPVGVKEALNVVVALFTGADPGASAEHRVIVAQIRLPRVLLAVIVGAALSVAGTAYQALLRNPLADPYILGVSSGAALGALSATVFAESVPLSRPIAAFAGAIATMAVVYFVGQGRRMAPTERLVLAGVIVNSFLSSGVIFLLTASGSRLQSAYAWLIGDLNADPALIPIVAVLAGIGIGIVFLNARSLNVMMTGEEQARALGVEVDRVKIVVYVAAALITGAAVAVSGVIGFVGLVVPHAIRLVAGSDNRLVIPASALVGGGFLLLADTLARTVIAPQELHVGVVTAAVGAPVFIWLLRRTN